MKQGKQKKALLPYQTILRASKGDPIAMEAVIGYYRPYPRERRYGHIPAKEILQHTRHPVQIGA